MPKQGTVILTPFPYSDLSGTKVRPAVVLSNHRSGDDFIVAFISSNVGHNGVTDISLKVTDSNFRSTGLKTDSLIRVAKLATLDKKIILGELGNVGVSTMKLIKEVLQKTFDI